MSHPVTTEYKPPVNYIFVDYENVSEVDLPLIGSKTVYFTLLLGARQSKLDAALVEKLVQHAASVQMVRLSSLGKNALDFTLAYYVGRAVQADPNAYFHIISKDKGFDPLIEHLVSRNIRAYRHDDFTTLTFSVPLKTPVLAPDDLLGRVVAHLLKSKTNLPKNKKKLLSHLLAFCGKSDPGVSVDALIDKLIKARQLSIGGKEVVTYSLHAK